MSIVGTRSTGTMSNLVSGKLVVRPVTVLPGGGCAAFVGAYVDGEGPGTGVANLIGVVYDASGNLVAVGDPVVVEQGADPDWVTLRVPVPDLPLLSAAFVGFVTSGASNVIRSSWISGSDVDALATTGTGGVPPDTLSGVDDITDEPSIFADIFGVWTPPEVEDMQLARLPWDASQRALGRTGPISSTKVTATSGWHGAKTDPEQGANCIVCIGGPLEDLVGERLKVTRRIGTLEHVSYVYCHDEQDFPDGIDEDLSLSRRAFSELGAPWLDDLVVTVEVLA